MNNQTCVGFLCHIINDETIYRYLKIVNESPYDVYWIINKYDSIENDVSKYPNINFVIVPSLPELKIKYKKIKYINEKKPHSFMDDGVHFNCILDYIEFFKIINQYEKYWFIEYDVYMKDFREMFNHYDNIDKDLITCNLYCKNIGYEFRPASKLYYSHNDNYYNIKKYALQAHSFFTIFRSSKKLLNRLIEYYSNYIGFFEDTIAMVCYYQNFSMINNEYCINSIDNTGSNSWIYEYVKDEYFKKNIIIHPIKENISFESLKNASQL